MRKGMLHAIIAFFARQRFFTSIDVNVVLSRQPIKESETVTISFLPYRRSHLFVLFVLAIGLVCEFAGMMPYGLKHKMKDGLKIMKHGIAIWGSGIL